MTTQSLDTRIAEQLAAMTWGDHSLLAYDEPAQSFEAVAVYFKAGIAEGAQCTYVVATDHSKEHLAGVLIDAGIPIESALACGALRLLTAKEYKPEGTFHSDVMTDRLRQLIDHASAGNFTGLRLAVEMDWTLVMGMTFDELIEWEAVATSLLLSGCRASAICLYRQSQFPREALEWLACAHTISLLGDTKPRDLLDREGSWTQAMHDLPHPPGDGGKARASVAFATIARAETNMARRLALLSEVGRILDDCALEYETTLHRVAHLCLPVLGDCSFIDLVGADGTTTCVAAAHIDPRRQEFLRDLQRLAPEQRHPAGVAKVLRTGQSEMRTEIGIPSGADGAQRSGIAHDDLHLHGAAVMSVPLVCRDQIIGALTFLSSDPNHRFRASDLRLAEDIASRAALAIENARLHQRAKEAIQTRNDVLGIVAHDLRNPLNVAALASRLLTMRDFSTQERQEKLQTIIRAMDRANRFITDLLDVATEGTGTALSLHKETVETGALVSDVYDMFAPLAEDNGIALIVNAEGAPRVIVADPHRITQVLANLLGNAVKFTSQGGSITLSIEPLGDDLCFAVADTGGGIEPSDLPHVFERFWHKRSLGGGTGLGLAIARAIVEAHGGRIWCESKVGVGSTFRLSIPARASASTPLG